MADIDRTDTQRVAAAIAEKLQHKFGITDTDGDPVPQHEIAANISELLNAYFTL
jgi:hypothetical protein